MTFFQKLSAAIAQNQSMLCVGLDPDPMRYPDLLASDPDKVFAFCASIVEATSDLVCAYKPQIAYFSAQRAERALERLIEYIHRTAPHIPVILDGKRGDIGSTATQYALEAFERYQADAVTLSPYMGFDTIEPYLRYSEKGVFLLCRTSNPGGADLQNLHIQVSETHAIPLFAHLAERVQKEWAGCGQVGLVVGATYPQELEHVRDIAPDIPLLIPGYGAQGASAQDVMRHAWNPRRPIVVNSSRAILYASSGQDFASAARQAALRSRDALQPDRAS